ncbi:uncharacterized protein F4812DRAFT_421940 [Daldinia caldariorum]|uniref:uncharacterized protein n=1 Tax=Daldinia caldariorum TaxID=326644 RepID=UPI0020079A50|nr:uncharacterized protein F4812DRAFT_421940 [Daldinia caldariorum]KAI1469062.1 hypothetical protein F4812DRAFT_421940 [Daldinia caldariorum]
MKKGFIGCIPSVFTFLPWGPLSFPTRTDHSHQRLLAQNSYLYTFNYTHPTLVVTGKYCEWKVIKGEIFEIYFHNLNNYI